MLTESAGYLQQIVESDVSLATLNAPYISGVEATMGCQLFLCPVLGLAKAPYSLSQPLPVCIAHDGCIGCGRL